MQGSRFKQYKKILQYAAAVICCGYIARFFYLNRQPLESVWNLDLITLLSMTALFLAACFAQSFRYRIVIHKVSDGRIPVFGWFRIFILGTFLNRIFPQAGNVYRSVSLKRRFGVSYTRYISTYTGFMWLDTTFSITVALAVVLLAEPGLRIGGVRAYLVIGVLGIVVAAVPFVLKFVSSLFEGRISYFTWMQSKLVEVLTVTAGSVRDGGYLCRFFITGLVSFFITLGTFYVCFKGLGMEVSISVLALFCVIMRLSNQLVLTPGNVGVRELAYGLLGSLAGVDGAQAMLASIILRIVGTAVIIALGAAFGGMGLLKKHAEYTESET